MKNWYIVQSHSSFENKVAQLIKEEAEKAKIQEKIEEIIVPIAMEAGLLFAIREGGRTVGSGQVLEIIE